jgi:hypothetical protein
VPVEVEPPELATLLECAERPRTSDWSLRAALTRYAQPQPQRVGDLLDAVRRIEFALGSYRATIESEGPAVWEAVQSDDVNPADRLIGLLRAMMELDHLGDTLAAWAADPTRQRPDAAVDAVIADVVGRLDELGIPREERQRQPRSRG